MREAFQAPENRNKPVYKAWEIDVNSIEVWFNNFMTSIKLNTQDSGGGYEGDLSMPGLKGDDKNFDPRRVKLEV